MAEQAEKAKILVVDDMPDNITVMVSVLQPDYDISVALDGEKAIKLAGSDPKPDMILLDIMMPGMNGFEVCEQLKSDPATSGIPVIFITAKDEVSDEKKGFELGAVDYITKPISPPILQARVRTQLALSDQKRELTKQVKKKTNELNHTRLQIIRHLGRAAEYKDNETGLHVIRMSHYSKLIAQAYGGNEAWIELVFNAAPMHDVGKIGIPDHVLLKPGKLDKDEWDLMKKHTDFGAEIIGDDPNTLLKMSRQIALTHHERWDGGGYPKGLAEDKIPLEGRIVAIADVFDALTSERPYKKAWPVEDAVDLIEKNRATQFDPELVALFLDLLPEVLKIKEEYGETSSRTLK